MILGLLTTLFTTRVFNIDYFLFIFDGFSDAVRSSDIEKNIKQERIRGWKTYKRRSANANPIFSCRNGLNPRAITLIISGHNFE